MDSGWPFFAFFAALAALLRLIEWNDERRGRTPRDWDE